MYPNILRRGAEREAFGAVYKAMLWERVGIEVFSTEISNGNCYPARRSLGWLLSRFYLVTLNTKLRQDHTNNKKKTFSIFRDNTNSRQVFRN